MDYYKNAETWEDSSNILFKSGTYQSSVFCSCLAVELYLKSKLNFVEHPEYLEASHDVIKLYRCLKKKFISEKDLTEGVTLCRKYFNESRYPFGDKSIYTKEFAKRFLDYVADVKDYIDKDCIISKEDLENKFQKPDR